MSVQETLAKFMLPLKELTVPLLVAICINGSANILAGFESTIVSFPKDVFAVAYQIGLRDDRYPWLVASAPLGAAIGCLPLLSGALTDRVGRKRAMMIVQVIYMLAALMTSTANGYDQFFAGRFFAGLAVGAMTNIAPVYMAEICPTALRAGLVGLTQVLIVLGVLLGFAISKPFVTAKPATWAPAFACATPFSALLLLLIPWTPESPRWLMAQGRTEEARTVLRQIRATKTTDEKAHVAAVEAELSVIAKSLAKLKQSAEGQAQGWLSRAAATLAAPHLLLAMGTGFTLGMFQQMSGMAAINRYSSTILGSGGAGFSAMAAVDAAIALNAWKLITVIAGDLILDHFGRRPMLFWGCLGMAASMLGVGGILRAAGGAVLTSDQSTAVVVLIALYILFYEVSVGPLLWVLSSEMFPTEVRGTAMSSGSTAVWLFSFAVSYFFPGLVSSYGLDGAFFFFGGFTCVAVAWAYLCVPETHRLPLEEVQSALKRWALLRWLTKAARMVRQACGLPVGPELELELPASSEGEAQSMVALRTSLCTASEGVPHQAAHLAHSLLPERLSVLVYGPGSRKAPVPEDASPAVPVVMTVAGSDSGGGAGIQADLKACSALGVFGTCAVTALTAQDSTGVHGVLAAPTDFLTQQMKVVLKDFKPQAMKTGMLADELTIQTVCAVLKDVEATSRPLIIVDPVMVATSGARLIEEAAVKTLRTSLLPLAYMVTPNLPEAEVLLGQAAGSIRTVAQMTDAAKAIAAMGPAWVLVKGGHLATPVQEKEAAGVAPAEGSTDEESVKVSVATPSEEETVLIPSQEVVDVLYCKATGAVITWTSPRVDTVNLHGTGCTLSASIAACLSRAKCLPDTEAVSLEDSTVAAVDAARRYLQVCLRGSAKMRLGQGKTGPFNHAVCVDDFQAGDAVWTAAMQDARLLY